MQQIVWHEVFIQTQ